MAKNIGATLSLKEGNFFTNIKNAAQRTEELKKKLEGGTKAMKKKESATKSLSGGLGSLAKKAAGAAAAYVGFNQAKDFLVDCATGVMELERANTRLETLLLNTKGNTKGMASAISAYGDELEFLTTIEGDATTAGASQLATFQLQGDNIKKLLPALQNLAVGQYGVNVTQDNMIQSANLLGKVMMGQTGALSKAGVSFSEQQKKILQTGTEAQKTATLIEVLDQNFGGLAEAAAQTDEGQIIQLRNVWGSVKDEVGKGVMPAIRSAVGYLNEKMPSIREKVSQTASGISGAVTAVASVTMSVMSGAGNVIGWVASQWNWLGPVIYGVVGAVTAYKTITGICNGVVSITASLLNVKTVALKAMTAGEVIATGATAALGTAVTFLTHPITLTVLAIGGLIAIGALLVKNWDRISLACSIIGSKISGVWTKVKDGFMKIWDGIVGYFKNRINMMITPINWLIKGINKIKINLPNWLGGHKIGFNIPEIPMLAKGGNIRQAGRVLVGERGPEVLDLPRGARVTPLDRATRSIKNIFHIKIDARDRSVDDILDELVPRLKLALSNM